MGALVIEFVRTPEERFKRLSNYSSLAKLYGYFRPAHALRR